MMLMTRSYYWLVVITFLLFYTTAFTQNDSGSVFKWDVTSTKISDNQYELKFSTSGAKGWQLYAPNQFLSDIATTELFFTDSAIQLTGSLSDTGNLKTLLP